jgi:hypothetical protein
MCKTFFSPISLLRVLISCVSFTLFFYPVLSVGFLPGNQGGILFFKVFSFGRSILINKKEKEIV